MLSCFRRLAAFIWLSLSDTFHLFHLLLRLLGGRKVSVPDASMRWIHCLLCDLDEGSLHNWDKASPRLRLSAGAVRSSRMVCAVTGIAYPSERHLVGMVGSAYDVLGR